MTEIRVVIATDEQAAMPAAAAVRSVIDNRTPGDRLHITVLDSGIRTGTHQRLLRSWISPRCAVTFVPVDTPTFAGMPTVSAVGTQRTVGVYARLLVGELLPANWNRVIYLDIDTITRSCLADLWHTDLGGRPLAGVRDDYIRSIASPYGLPTWRQLGLDPSLPYFNSGVLLIDLDTWRRAYLGQRALDYLDEHRDDIRLFDQDALNAVAAGNWLELDTTWNVTGYWRKPERRTGTRAHVLTDARIRHFAGHGKPWDPDPLTIPDADLFFTSLDHTDWAGWRPSRDTPAPSQHHTQRERP